MAHLMIIRLSIGAIRRRVNVQRRDDPVTGPVLQQRDFRSRRIGKVRCALPIQVHSLLPDCRRSRNGDGADHLLAANCNHWLESTSWIGGPERVTSP